MKISKLLIGLSVIASIALLVQFGLYLRSYQQVKNIQRLESYNYEIRDNIDQLLLNKETGYLRSDVSQDEFDAIHQGIQSLEEKGLATAQTTQKFNEVTRRFDAQDAVNSMYVENVLIEDTIRQDIPYVETLDLVRVNQVSDYYYDSPQDDFQHTINEIIDNSHTEFSQYEHAIEQFGLLENLPLESGYYEIIASVVSRAEEAYVYVHDERLVNDLNQRFQDYALRFVNQVYTDVPDVLNNAELQEAMSISPYIRRVLMNE